MNMLLTDHQRSEYLKFVVQALAEVHKEPGELISRRLSEQAIAHRIAVHLEKKFPTHSVDCEYNRNSDGTNLRRPKELVYGQEKLTKEEFRIIFGRNDKGFFEALMENRPYAGELKLSLPDIVVHERMSNLNNLIVIEVKYRDDRRGNSGLVSDAYRIKAFTSQIDGEYQYGIGFLVILDKKSTNVKIISAYQGSVHDSSIINLEDLFKKSL